MSLNWNWDDKMGEVIYDDGTKQNLYQGNAHMIALHEYTEDGKNYYNLVWFSSGKDHLRNMLGLTKSYGEDNLFIRYGITGFRFNTRYKSVPSIIADLTKAYTKAKHPLTIELYYEEVSA